MLERTCRECGESKPLTEEHYAVEKRRPDGTALFRPWCRPCHLARRSDQLSERKQRKVEQKRAARARRRELEMESERTKVGAVDSLAFPKLPAAPLGNLLEKYAYETGMTYEVLGKFLGVSDKALREWRKTGRTAYFNMGDKVICRLGLAWWEVWTEKNCTPEELALVEYAFTGEGPLAQGSQLALEEVA